MPRLRSRAGDCMRARGCVVGPDPATAGWGLRGRAQPNPAAVGSKPEHGRDEAYVVSPDSDAAALGVM